MLHTVKEGIHSTLILALWYSQNHQRGEIYELSGHHVKYGMEWNGIVEWNYGMEWNEFLEWNMELKF